MYLFCLGLPFLSTVFRHADRTPKQKLKFNFPIAEPWAKPFVVLLNGEKEEIILREAKQLRLIANAISEAKALGASGEDLAKLEALRVQLGKKIDLPGTKAQLKPGYSKRIAGSARKLVKLQLVFKWGGEVCMAIFGKQGLDREFISVVVYTCGQVSVSRFRREHEEGHFYHE